VDERLNLTLVQKMKTSSGSNRFPTIKEIVDLSVPMKGLDTPVFAGYPEPIKATFTTIAQHGYSSFLWTFVEHTGTHVDSPAHFFESGPAVNEVPLERYVGPGVVLDFSNKPAMYSITRGDIVKQLDKLKLGEKVDGGWILLFYTNYTSKARTPQWMEHPELSEEACGFISGLEVNAIGFDAPSPDHSPFPGHKILLPKKIGIYENLTNLDKLLGKEFFFVGAPLSLHGGSASPVRAFALVF
jgi:arylformamidase